MVHEPEEQIELAWDEYMKDMKEFCQMGDERDSVPCFKESYAIIELRKDISEDRKINKRFKKSLLKDIKEKMKKAENIEDKAETHRYEMQCHSSGSSYHQALAEFQEALGW